MDYKKLLQNILDTEEKNAIEIGVDFPYNETNGVFDKVSPSAWTNGYYPGLMWLSYLASGKEIFKETAIKLEEKLDEVINSFTMPGHDVGFVWLLSSGIHNIEEANPKSRIRLLNMATYLAGRFNIKGNYIRAWECEDGNTEVPTRAIIDCMMNIPLLFVASAITGDPRFSHIAIAHADTTMKHFIDSDGAVRHICRFNPQTGEFMDSIGGQGYSPVSSWSRGASWAIYGFAMAYRYTHNKEYLETAKKVAKFFVSQIQDDYIPAWDFRAPNKETKDSSAGAIAASGMLEIYFHTKDDYYKEQAEKIIISLSENCMSPKDSQSILQRATAFFGANENVEVGLIYADYYFTEAVYKLASEDLSLPWEKK